MNTKALQLASRFALPPNSLGYCGKDSAPEKLKKCILGKDCEGVTKEMDNFIVLSPYLKMLSKILNKKKYSYEVVEAYWFGNEELNNVRNNHYALLLENFSRQGVPSFFVQELKRKVPKKFIPTHLFQVLHVGVGKASGSVPYNIDTINDCMIRWGKVEKIGKNELTVNLNSLARTKGGFRLVKQIGTFPFRVDFVSGLKKGDYVSLHWKQVVKRLTKEEVRKLTYWTNKVFTSLT